MTNRINQMAPPGRYRPWLSVCLLLLIVPCIVRAQFIHIFEVQDENRAPKSDLFNPSEYKYVSPAQLQKQQQQNKPARVNSAPVTARPTTSPTRPTATTAAVPEYRSNPSPVTISTLATGDDSRTNEISNIAMLRSQRARSDTDRYSSGLPQSSVSPSRSQSSAPTQPVTYMQPISAILANITANEIRDNSEMELRKQIRQQQQQQQQQQQPSTSSSSAPENRYSRTTPLRVSAQNQRQYVVRVPAPFAPNQAGPSSSLPHEQLPPNLSSMQSHYNPSAQSSSVPTTAQSSPRLSTLNSMLQAAPSEQGIPSSLLNSFLSRQSGGPPSGSPQSIAQPPYAANLPSSYVTPAPTRSVPMQLQTPSHTPSSQAPTGRAVGGNSLNLQSLQPPVTNKESLTDEDIRLIEEHNRKVRLFLQQRQQELVQEQEQLKAQKAAQEAAAKAQQEASLRAAEQDRIRRLRAEQEAASRAAAEQERVRRLRAEQEVAARAAAEAERLRRIKEQEDAAARAAAEAERVRRIQAEQEAAARAAAEAERARRYRAEQEAAARAAAEQERIRRIKAEQEAAARAAEEERIRRIQEEEEAAARAAAEQERIRRLRAEQEAAARAAAEAERIRRFRAEQEVAAKAAAEAEQVRRIKAEQEAAARAAAQQERIRRLRAEQEQLKRIREEQEAAAEQEQIRRLRAEQEAAAQAAAAAEQERLRQLRAQQEAAARLAEAERERITHMRAQQEVAAIREQYQNRNQPLPTSNLTNSLSYQPESNLGYEDMIRNVPQNPSDQSVGMADSARLRAEKEALAEQERLLRFQASQQALAQQQATEQARLRKLREDELLRAEEERLARDAQERQIMRARNEQNRVIQAARDAAARNLARETSSVQYTPYTEDVGREYPPTNYTELNNANSNSNSAFGSLNNVRTPEPRRLSSVARTNSQSGPLPTSAAIQPPTISEDYIRRITESSLYNTANQTSSSQLAPSRIASQPRRVIDTNQYQNSAPSRRPSPPSSAPQATNSNGDNQATTTSGHKPAKISLQELPPDLDLDGIPGVAGKDYPTLTEIPKTSFSCARQPLNGYYADTETACQVVHMCQAGGVQDSFLCPNGTIWNQEKFACQWWYEVSCATAPSFYALNNKLYKDKDTDKQGSLSSSRRA